MPVFKRIFHHVRTDLIRKPLYPAMPIKAEIFTNQTISGQTNNLHNIHKDNTIDTRQKTANIKQCLIRANRKSTSDNNEKKQSKVCKNAGFLLNSIKSIENVDQIKPKMGENLQKKEQNKSNNNNLLNFLPERTSSGRILRKPSRYLLTDDINKEKSLNKKHFLKKVSGGIISKSSNRHKNLKTLQTNQLIAKIGNRSKLRKMKDRDLKSIPEKCALRSTLNKNELQKVVEEIKEPHETDLVVKKSTSGELMQKAILMESLNPPSIEQNNFVEVLNIKEEMPQFNDIAEEVQDYSLEYVIDNALKTPQNVLNCEGICGAVDIKTFQLNCIICANKYPLHQWLKFLKHFKLYHPEYLDSQISMNECDNILNTAINTMEIKESEDHFNSFHSYNAAQESKDQEITIDARLSAKKVEGIENLNVDEVITELDSKITNEIGFKMSLSSEEEDMLGNVISDDLQDSLSKINEDEGFYIRNNFDNKCNYESQSEESNDFEEGEITTDISNNSDEEMTLNNLNEDEEPKPSNGCGIILGVTNKLVVMEFFRLLEAYPILYEPRPNCTQKAYDKALTSIRFILNDKFNVGLTDFEMRTTVRRIIDWYYKILRKIRNQSLEKDNKCDIQSELYEISYQSDCIPDKFKSYFEICSRFLPGYLIDEKTLHNFVVVNPYNIHITYPPWITFSPENNLEEPSEEDESTHEKKLDSKLNLNSVKTELKSKQMLKEYQCDECGKILTQKATLKTHKFYHGKPKHVCQTCGKSFFRKYWLDSHIKSKHKTETIPYICEYCGKAIYSHGTFRMHKLTVHMNLRYTCVVCNYQTQSRRYLQQHQIKRHQALEGTIEELSKLMKPQGMRLIPRNSEYHDGYLWKLSVRKPGIRMFSCITCQLVFDRYKDILHHNKEFHPIRHKTYMCVLCPPGKTLMRSSLRRHYTVMHKVAAADLENLMCRTKHVQSLDEVSETSSKTPCNLIKKREKKPSQMKKKAKDLQVTKILSRKQTKNVSNIKEHIISATNNVFEPSYESCDRVEIETNGIIEVDPEYENVCEELIFNEEYLVNQAIHGD